MSAVYSDLNLSFKKHPGTHDVLRRIDVEAVKTSLKTLVMGSPFDSPFDPHYGGGIRAMLFENMTPGSIIVAQRRLQLKIEEYEPRVVLENLEFKQNENYLDIEIQYYVVGIATLQKLTLTLERAR